MSESISPPESANPYTPPQAAVTAEPGPPVDAKYDGIGRFGFLISNIAIMALIALLGVGYGPPIVLIGWLLLMLPASSRLKNIGRNPAWCLLLLVPLLNLFVIAPCLLLPPGYQDYRRLDTAAKMIAWLLVAALVVCLMMLFVELRKL